MQNHCHHVIPTESSEESELIEIAEELPESSWQNPLWSNFLQALDSADLGHWDQFDSALEDISSTVEGALEQYSQLRLLESEITRETVLGNMLLLEGLESWRTALQVAVDAAESETSWDLALMEAERGCRLLMTVSIHAERVRLAA